MRKCEKPHGLLQKISEWSKTRFLLLLSIFWKFFGHKPLVLAVRTWRWCVSWLKNANKIPKKYFQRHMIVIKCQKLHGLRQKSSYWHKNDKIWFFAIFWAFFEFFLQKTIGFSINHDKPGWFMGFNDSKNM